MLIPYDMQISLRESFLACRYMITITYPNTLPRVFVITMQHAKELGLENIIKQCVSDTAQLYNISLLPHKCVLVSELTGINSKGFSPFKKMMNVLAEKYPVLDEPMHCPVPTAQPGHREVECESVKHVRGAIVHLNDRHNWSREEIATWVEGLEGK